MKKIFVAVMMSGLLASVSHGEERQITASTSKLTWEGTKVVGGSHQGTLAIKKGKVTFKNRQPATASVVVDMTSIVNTDLKDPKWNQKLVGHLKSDDFFAVAKHKEAKIEVNNFKKEKNGKYKLSGNLTIKGVTKKIQLDADTVRDGNSVKSFKAKLKFDRTEFGIRYGSGKFFDNLGDKMISDEVKVDISIELNKPIVLGSK